jgi:hypothetical protein
MVFELAERDLKLGVLIKEFPLCEFIANSIGIEPPEFEVSIASAPGGAPGGI